MIPHEMVGTIPGWITAAGSISILGVVLRYRLGWRKLDVEAQAVQVTAANVREADIRDHYADEVKRLSEWVAAVDAAYEDCKREREDARAEAHKFRQQVAQLETKLTSITRQFVAFQLETAKAIPPENVSPEMQKMLISLDILAKGDGK